MDLFSKTLADVSLPINTSSGVAASSNDSVKLIQSFLCILEGWKTKVKNLHWAASNLNTHKVLDEVASFINDFQDYIAEDCMGQSGKFNSTFLKGVPCMSGTTKELLEDMSTKTYDFYNALPEKPTYKGIKSETEVFIHNINKYRYLINLCE